MPINIKSSTRVHCAAVLLFGFFTGSGLVSAQTSVDALHEIQTIICPDSMHQTLEILTGQKTASIDGREMRITSRNFDYPGNDMAADWISNTLIRWGYWVDNHYFNDTGRNVLAVKEGTESRDTYIICAHYDSWPIDDPSPGADDNASGVAVVLEAARIFSKMTHEATLIFGLWDEEELGYFGARHYIDSYWPEETQPAGVINIDMIAYDSDNDFKTVINTNKWVPQSSGLYALMDSLNTAMHIDLDLIEHKSRISADQQMFWDSGINAVGVHEDVIDDDNIHYHSKDDKIEYINFPYFNKIAELCILSFASLGRLSVGSSAATKDSPAEYKLFSSFPNPFNASTTWTFTLDKKSEVHLSVFDLKGRRIAQLIQQPLPAGHYSIPWHADNLPSGLYLGRLQTSQWVRTRKIVLQR